MKTKNIDKGIYCKVDSGYYPGVFLAKIKEISDETDEKINFQKVKEGFIVKNINTLDVFGYHFEKQLSNGQILKIVDGQWKFLRTQMVVKGILGRFDKEGNRIIC